MQEILISFIFHYLFSNNINNSIEKQYMCHASVCVCGDDCAYKCVSNKKSAE